MLTPKEMFDEMFPSTRTPRSNEYKAGVKAALAFCCNETPFRCKYPMGTPYKLMLSFPELTKEPRFGAITKKNIMRIKRIIITQKEVRHEEEFKGKE